MLQKDGSQPAKCDGKSQSCGPTSGCRRWCGAFAFGVFGCRSAICSACRLRPIPAAPSRFNSSENLIIPSFVLGAADADLCPQGKGRNMRKCLCIIAALGLALPLWGSGHGPVFGYATPTNSQGEWSFDFGLLE